MKTFFYPKTVIALAMAIAAATGSVSQAQDQPMPPPAGASVLPPEIEPNTPLAEVVKLVQSGVDVVIIKNYVASSAGAFNLDADKIITLKDLGVPTEVVNAMMDRDKALYLVNNTPPPAPEPTPATTDTAPPTEPVTVNYFNDSLTPYGSWVVVEGYGRCWRPTTVIYDSGWRPYCDRGHWVYTDCGWYWDSDYAWGVTFHYGRWFRHDRFGWCWYPDTQWAPSWVTWRSSSDYCGWAPLPPLAVYRPGAGFFYRGASVAVSFDFGLRADCFTFVSPDHFCEQHPRRFCVEPARVAQVYGRTTVINNFDVHNTFVVNTGIDVARIPGRDHHPIQPVHVGSLPNAGRQGWRGDGDHQGQHASGNNNNNNPGHTIVNGGGNNGQFNHGQGNSHQGPGNGGQSQVINHGVGSPYVLPSQQTPRFQGNNNNGNQNNGGGSQNSSWNQNNSGNHNGQRDRGTSNGSGNPQTSTQASTAGQPQGNNNVGNDAGVRTSHGSVTGNSGNWPRPVTTAPAGSLILSGTQRSATPAPSQQYQQPSQQRQQQISPPVVAERSAQREQGRNVPVQPPVVSAPPAVHAAPPPEQHVETRPVHIDPPQQHSSPPPAVSQPSQSQSHDSDRSNRGSNNDKKNQ
ncbi:MAG TPA: DUF6600 domain-containing protein [Candidatus Acidoferrales bacterium]|nr:DUF6600 domain-containing protein [Candidatus Acidoferrales bacterium]